MAAEPPDMGISGVLAAGCWPAATPAHGALQQDHCQEESVCQHEAHTLYAAEQGREKNSWHPHGNSSSLASGATEIRESINESSVRSHQLRNYPSYRGPPRVRRSTLNQVKSRLRLATSWYY